MDGSPEEFLAQPSVIRLDLDAKARSFRANGRSIRRDEPAAEVPPPPSAARGKATHKTKKPVDPNDTRPLIRLRANNIERIVDESEGALIGADCGIYQRGGLIVSLESVKAKAASGDEINVQRICERHERSLQEDLSSAASFEKFDARTNDFVAADPPMTIVNTLQARKGRLRFPVLAGVVNSPTMRGCDPK